MILFTGTLPSSGDPKSEVRDAVDAANKSGVAFYPVDVRPVFAQTDPGDVPHARRPSRPIMTQRGGGPGGGAQGDSDALSSPLPDSGAGSQQVLFGLANGTGGLVVRNTTDLLGGLQNIAQEQDQYYALTYVAPESKEGTCHTIRVKVDRKGTTVRSRTSYCTSKPLGPAGGNRGRQAVGAARSRRRKPATSPPPSSFRIFIPRPTWRASTWPWRSKPTG